MIRDKREEQDVASSRFNFDFISVAVSLEGENHQFFLKC